MNLKTISLMFVMQFYVIVARDITRDEFLHSVVQCEFPIPNLPNIYSLFHAETTKYAMSLEEQAIFLAQLISNSFGFQRTKEWVCQKTKLNYDQETNIWYYGRGFLHIVGVDQYKAASSDLGLGQLLLHRPKEVEIDKTMAMKVSGWFWQNYVRQELFPIDVICGLKPFKFGVTTKAIVMRTSFSFLCNGQPNQKAKKRYECYLKIANILNIQDKALEDGCYN